MRAESFFMKSTKFSCFCLISFHIQANFRGRSPFLMCDRDHPVGVPLTSHYHSATGPWSSHYLTVLKMSTLGDARYQAFLNALDLNVTNRPKTSLVVRLLAHFLTLRPPIDQNIWQKFIKNYLFYTIWWDLQNALSFS